MMLSLSKHSLLLWNNAFLLWLKESSSNTLGSGCWCQLVLIGVEMIFGQWRITMPAPMCVLTISRISWARNTSALTRELSTHFLKSFLGSLPDFQVVEWPHGRYICSCLDSLLDKSMSIWHSMDTCPGWVFCPCKPHPFGNEYHSMCCGKSGVMLNVEMVEGKDCPREVGQSKIEDRGSDLSCLPVGKG